MLVTVVAFHLHSQKVRYFSSLIKFNVIIYENYIGI